MLLAVQGEAEVLLKDKQRLVLRQLDLVEISLSNSSEFRMHVSVIILDYKKHRALLINIALQEREKIKTTFYFITIYY